MIRVRISLGLLGASLALLVVGCGDKYGGRRDVTGTVLFKGQPLEEGIIDFEPEDGQGSKSGASILKGQYTIPMDKGLIPGKYKVSIVAGDGTVTSGMAEPSGRAKPGATPGKERIPPEYNVKSNISRR